MCSLGFQPAPAMGIHESGYMNPGGHRDRQMPANGVKAIPKALHKYTVEAEQAMSATGFGGGRPESPNVGIAGLLWSWQFGQASVHIVPANGLKAQKHQAQGKRSDTLGNARPSRVYALKGQKHNYAFYTSVAQRGSSRRTDTRQRLAWKYL